MGDSSKVIPLNELIPHSHDEVRGFMEHPHKYSMYENYPEFRLFIIRKMTFVNESLSFDNRVFIFVNNNIYRYDEDLNGFFVMTGRFKELLNSLETYYLINQKILTEYSEGIEKLETGLFRRDVPKYFMDLWFDIKKDLARIENFYYRNIMVYREFFKKHESEFVELHDEFKDIEESIQFQNSNVTTLKTRLDSLHHYHDSIKADRLNTTLLTLTIISGIFLPLNLVVGFFGMNTGGLFYLNDAKGTEKVLIILGIILGVCLLGFKVIKVIDNYILRFILGRYDFYKNLSSRIFEIDKRLTGK